MTLGTWHPTVLSGFSRACSLLPVHVFICFIWSVFFIAFWRC